MAPDRPALGIALMILFCAIAPLGDSMAKLLGPSIPLAEMLLVRFAAQALILLPIVWATGRTIVLSRRVLGLTALRTVFHVIGSGTMFAALWYMPVADAVAITFVMPFILLLLGRFLLGEEVGPRRLAACAVGFVGTLLVIQPSFASIGWPALLPLGVAMAFALYQLVARLTARDNDPIALQAVSGLVATAALGVLLAAGSGSDIALLDLKMPDQREALLLAAISLIGTAAHLVMTWALRYAPSATLAPMQYLEIPFATLVGWLIFSDFPNGLAALGIAITVAAGLYVVFRERATVQTIPVES
ncbi:MAG: DMT family transporter [Rhizobiaceae bacterium]|nr:DMT family transporter [Rhizobiaceae bacterium]